MDNSGAYLDFAGGFEADKMILSREISLNDQSVIQRMVWYNITENSIDWNWEKSTDSGVSWTILWQIHYKRKVQ